MAKIMEYSVTIVKCNFSSFHYLFMHGGFYIEMRNL